jgi:hypothetical protein
MQVIVGVVVQLYTLKIVRRPFKSILDVLDISRRHGVVVLETCWSSRETLLYYWSNTSTPSKLHGCFCTDSRRIQRVSLTMARREIAPLRILCLRAVGHKACSAEQTFKPRKGDKESTASRLLRSFHQSGMYDSIVEGSPVFLFARMAYWSYICLTHSLLLSCITLDNIPREPCFGGSASNRRADTNEIDINHPFIATRATFSEFGNPALDCLQSYIDSLVELGRLDDSRLGLELLERMEEKCWHP